MKIHCPPPLLLQLPSQILELPSPDWSELPVTLYIKSRTRAIFWTHFITHFRSHRSMRKYWNKKHHTFWTSPLLHFTHSNTLQKQICKNDQKVLPYDIQYRNKDIFVNFTKYSCKFNKFFVWSTQIILIQQKSFVQMPENILSYEIHYGNKKVLLI